MRTEALIKHTIKELELNAEEMELWDGEPDLYINNGWIEALNWVLGNRKKRDKWGS
tara:strand:+ start:286 stop:453 length:168 start_codon:yes stop_codon:yes gene_type:complete